MKASSFVLIFFVLAISQVSAYTIPVRSTATVHKDWVPVILDIEGALNERNAELYRRSQDGGIAKEVPLHLSFNGYDYDFHLELVVNSQLFSPDAVFYAKGKALDVDRNNFLRGHVVGFDNSSARMVINTATGTASGIIFLPSNKTTFIIDQPENLLLREKPPTGTRLVMVRTQHESSIPVSKSNVSSNVTEPRQRRRESDPESMRTSPLNTVCDLYLDADITFLQQWGGDGTPTERHTRTLEKMFALVNEVSSIYASNFDFFKLSIVGAEIHEEVDSITPNVQETTAEDILDDYEHWLPLRNRIGLQHDQVCLNHLFVHVSTTGSLGIAEVAQEAGGGVCDQNVYEESPTQDRAINTGITTSLTEGETNDFYMMAATMAHEIGHNIGANHDCCSDHEEDSPFPPTFENCNKMDFCHRGCEPRIYGQRYCRPMQRREDRCVVGNDFEDFFIMYPHGNKEINDRARYNSGSGLTFSPCSIDDISATLQALGHCLHAPIEV